MAGVDRPEDKTIIIENLKTLLPTVQNPLVSDCLNLSDRSIHPINIEDLYLRSTMMELLRCPVVHAVISLELLLSQELE
jgi:hypothetical protein